MPTRARRRPCSRSTPTSSTWTPRTPRCRRSPRSQRRRRPHRVLLLVAGLRLPRDALGHLGRRARRDRRVRRALPRGRHGRHGPTAGRHRADVPGDASPLTGRRSSMRIGVVSDTHLPRFGRSLPEALVAELREVRVERLIHCGDWTDPFVVELLEEIAPVDGVAGNNDPPELAARFGYAPVVELEGVRVGITHGHIGPGADLDAGARAARVRQAARPCRDLFRAFTHPFGDADGWRHTAREPGVADRQAPPTAVFVGAADGRERARRGGTQVLRTLTPARTPPYMVGF